MWAKIRQFKGRNQLFTHSSFSAVDLNKHFAAVSNDPHYITPSPRLTCLPTPSNLANISEYRIFTLLDSLKDTATGMDDLPAWFLRLCAPSFSLPIAKLFTLSLSSSTVPTQWKHACITPLPKVPQPSTCSDYRPISITPVLSRLLEKLVVRHYLYPTLAIQPFQSELSNQFAFRPSGSTTSALISLLHTLSSLASSYPFVYCFALDFSKAFDTLRHSTLMSKLASLPIPDYLYNWFISFLGNRRHSTKLDGITSPPDSINSSVVQGSGLGPALFILGTRDLKAITPGNALLKYADDTYLIIPSYNSHTIAAELTNIESWAATCNLSLNKSKTKELIFHRPSGPTFPSPPLTVGIQRVDNLKILGVTVSGNFSFKKHVDDLISSGSQTLYALKTLKAHGLSSTNIFAVTHSTLISKLTYCAPAWHGFSSCEDINRIDSIIKRAQRWCLHKPTAPNISLLWDKLDHSLFKSIQLPNHVLHHMLPPSVTHTYQLRSRPHHYSLPTKSPMLSKNFLQRMLYKDIY